MKLPLAARVLVLYGTRFPNHPGKWWLHAKLRNLFCVSVPGEIEVNRAGLRWLLRPSDYTQAKLFWLGAMDKWDLFHIRRLLPPAPVIFDVGANFGYYSLILGRQFAPTCRAYSFEPNPPTFQRLETNVRLNDMARLISLHPLALSDHVGTTRLVDARPDNAGAAYISDGPDGITVNLTTLDEFAKRNDITRMNFLKMDVEGNEESVIRGGMHTLRSLRPIILIEIHPVLLTKMNSSAQAVMALLRELGYRLYSINRKQLEPLLSPPPDLTNALCLPDEQSP